MEPGNGDIPPDIMRKAVETAILSRRSVRGFLPTPVSRATLERLLEVASRAPSGSNVQPWKVHVVLGPALDRLKAELIRTYESGAPEEREYDYYPVEWRSPYLDRRRKVGWDMFALAGVAKGDREGSARQRGRNYVLFDAPAGMIFTIDSHLTKGSWLDFGMFIENIMIAARGHGLDTCPQAALANYPRIIRSQLGVLDTETIVCGMGIGTADPNEPTNRLVTEREPVAGFATFHES